MYSIEKKRRLNISGWAIMLLFFFSSNAWGFGLSDVFQAGGAYLTQVLAHEAGHNVMAHMSGGKDVQMNLFTRQNGDFFVGASSVGEIDSKSVLPFRAAGVVASNHTFDVALSSYRRLPTSYNKALLFFSGTDFLWYSVWSFYIKGSDDPYYDPVGIKQETGLSSEAIMGIALVQTALNAFRLYSGDDTTLPYISVDKEWMKVGIQVRF